MAFPFLEKINFGGKEEDMHLKKNDLKDLVLSLTTGEKRYFFQYLKSLNHQESPLYLTLFNQQERDFAQTAGKQSLQTHTKAKRRLYRHLIQSLRQYHQEKSVAAIIQNLLCEIEILYDRGLSRQSLILLKKAYGLALAGEHYGLLLQILSWERKLNIVMDNPDRTHKEIAQEEKVILENLNQIIELENIYSRAKEIKRKSGYVKGVLKQELERITIKNPRLSGENRPESQRGRYYYHFIYSLYYVMVLDTRQAYDHSKQLLAKEIQQVLPNEYLDGILEHVTSCLGLGYFEEMQAGLQAAAAFGQQKRFEHAPSFLVRLFYFQTCYTLIMYIYTGNLPRLLEAIRQTETQVALYDQQLSVEMKLVIYGNLRNAYIASGSLDKAETLLEVLLYKESKLVREDVYNDLFLSRVFSFLAAETYVLVPAMALSANRQYRQTKSHESQMEVGLKITAILMKDYDYDNERIRRDVLLKVRAVLTTYIASLKGLNSFQEIYTFYLLWIDSMLSGNPFHLIASDWYARHREQTGR